MRILIIVAMTILAIGSSLAGSKTPLTDRCPKTTPEARGLQLVECPAAWPPGKGASLKSAEFWNMDWTPGAPLCGAGKNEEIDITGLVSPSDVGCTYANGDKLLISVPGTPVECWTADEKRFRTGHFNDGLVCYFRPTGDQSKDEIKITKLEKLTRASELFGLRLGMTRMETEQALNTQGARITASGDDLIRATLSDGKEITAVSARDGKARDQRVETLRVPARSEHLATRAKRDVQLVFRNVDSYNDGVHLHPSLRKRARNILLPAAQATVRVQWNGGRGTTLRNGLLCPWMSRSPIRHRWRYTSTNGASQVTRMRADGGAMAFETGSKHTLPFGEPVSGHGYYADQFSVIRR